MKTQDAVKHFGTYAKVGEALGISKQAVFKWGEKVPPRRQYEIEMLTDGALRADTPFSRERAA